MKEAVKEGTVKKKKIPEVFINSKDTVSVSHIDEFKSHRSSALHGIKIATGRTEAAAAAERNKFKLAAMGTAIHGATKRVIATVDHFINIFYYGIPRMQSINYFFKMICKNTL